MPNLNPDGTEKRFRYKPRDGGKARDSFKTDRDLKQYWRLFVLGRYLKGTWHDRRFYNYLARRPKLRDYFLRFSESNQERWHEYQSRSFTEKRKKVDMNRSFPRLNLALNYDSAVNKDQLREQLKFSQIFNRTYFDEYERADGSLLDLLGNEFLDNLIYKKQLEFMPEVQHVINFLDSVVLDYCLTFHDGTTVVNYPLDYAMAEGTHGVETPSPDDRIYKDVSRSYWVVF